MSILPENVFSRKRTDTSNRFKVDYRGSVATESNLPSSGVPKGTVYNVEEDGSNYLFNGESWDRLDSAVAKVTHLIQDITGIGSVFTVPTHKVGSPRLVVILNGVVLEEGEDNQYLDTTSTSITLNITVANGDILTAIVV